MEQLDTVYKSLYKLYSTTQKYFVKYSQLNLLNFLNALWTVHKGPWANFQCHPKNFDGKTQLGAKEGEAMCENMTSTIKNIFHYN